MTGEIDHFDTALTAIESTKGMSLERATVRVAEAQVHATLALIEQQRAANLIALANSHDSTLRAIGFDALVEFLPSEGFSAPEPRMHSWIRAGLGL